jgi:hypothetical protein
MGTIGVVPENVADAGSQISALAPAAAELGAVAQSAGCGAPDPPRTAAALADCAAQWAGAAASLEAELQSLGQSAQAAAFFYTQADERSMGGGG